ncbi:hypothetical protein ES703_47541 [subsurface metagenome]
MEIATKTPVIILPIKSPPRASGPKIKPTKIGAKIGIKPGTIICFKAERVTISTHLPYSGLALPSIKPLISLNCLLTSITTLLAVLATAVIAKEAKRYGKSPPKNKPIITL